MTRSTWGTDLAWAGSIGRPPSNPGGGCRRHGSHAQRRRSSDRLLPQAQGDGCGSGRGAASACAGCIRRSAARARSAGGHVYRRGVPRALAPLLMRLLRAAEVHRALRKRADVAPAHLARASRGPGKLALTAQRRDFSPLRSPHCAARAARGFAATRSAAAPALRLTPLEDARNPWRGTRRSARSRLSASTRESRVRMQHDPEPVGGVAMVCTVGPGGGARSSSSSRQMSPLQKRVVCSRCAVRASSG